MTKDENSQNQFAICHRYHSRLCGLLPDARIGIAIKTMRLRPLNGLRHPARGDMSGWYIWGGEYSSDTGFFQVLHVKHIAKEFPEILKFLALEPGFRFLSDGDYMDVWFDVNLLKI
jgi:hypothetical protein